MKAYIYLQVSDKWYDVVSKGIQYVTRSDWSHAGFYCPDHADGKHFLSAQKDGVKWRTRDKHCKIILIDAPGVTEAMQWAESQIGKPYDFGAIAGILFDRDWRDPSKWFCSELVAYAFEAVKQPLFNTITLINRIFPDLLLLPKEISVVTDVDTSELN